MFFDIITPIIIRGILYVENDPRNAAGTFFVSQILIQQSREIIQRAKLTILACREEVQKSRHIVEYSRENRDQVRDTLDQLKKDGES